MYEYIKGIFKGIKKDCVVVENGGIGYKIYTSGSTMAMMPNIDEDVFLYLHQIIREDFHGLYGFITEEELELFNKLITINGVGAKASLSLLSIGSANKLKYAIVSGDEKFIIKAPGIGKKIAQRIILELRDKISVSEEAIVNNIDNGLLELEVNKNLSEALGALISLGYSEKEAEKAINKADSSKSLEDIIKECLKYLMS